MTDSNYSVISFFSGAMGLDVGLEQAGLNVRVAQELNKQAIQTIQLNNHKVVPGDLNELLLEDISLNSLKTFGNLSKDEDVFAVVGGPPCQSFSTAGKRLGLEDKRGLLIFSYIDAINVLQPRFAILENVKGVLSTPGITHDKLIDDIIESFNNIGYTVMWSVVDAVNYGAAQFRERLIIIASRDDEDVFIPLPTHFQKHQNEDYRWNTLKNVIIDSPILSHDFTQFSPKVLEVMKVVPPENNWRGLPHDVMIKAMGGTYNNGGGASGCFRRLRLNEPAPTLVTSPVQKTTMLGHPFEDRPLSIQEYSRIQGFPDDWKFAGTTAQIYKQIGNAVPVPLGYAIGSMLKSVADNNSTVVTKRKR